MISPNKIWLCADLLQWADVPGLLEGCSSEYLSHFLTGEREKLTAGRSHGECHGVPDNNEESLESIFR